MPSWDAKLHVRNFPTFFHEMKVQTRMTEPQKAQLDEVFASVNGKKPSGKEDVLIAIHRQKGQPAMVGNITFDRFLELLKLASGN